MIGAGCDRGHRRHDAFLVAGLGARRPDARRHQHHAGAHDRAQHRRLLARADQPVDSDVARLRRAFAHELRTREVVAGRGQVGIIVGGKHGDGEQPQGRAFARVDRGVHGLRIGVHREERCAERRDAFDSLGDGVADIVELEVQKNALARAREHLGEVDAARESQLVADLVERDRLAEPHDNRLSLRHRRHIQRNDQPLPRIKAHGEASSVVLLSRRSGQ